MGDARNHRAHRRQLVRLNKLLSRNFIVALQFGILCLKGLALFQLFVELIEGLFKGLTLCICIRSVALCLIALNNRLEFLTPQGENNCRDGQSKQP